MNPRLRFLFVLALLLSFTQNSKAQSTAPEVSLYWKFITERSQADFFYRIADCDNKKYLFLRVKNDMPKERVISFTIEINGGGKITKEISLNTAPVAILEPDCMDKEKNKILKIELSPQFDAASLEVKIKLHE